MAMNVEWLGRRMHEELHESFCGTDLDSCLRPAFWHGAAYRIAHGLVIHADTGECFAAPSHVRVHIVNGQPCDDPTCYRSHGLAGS